MDFWCGRGCGRGVTHAVSLLRWPVSGYPGRPLEQTVEQDRPQFEGMHHVLVGVPPEAKEAAHRFYEDVLGFVPVASPLESGGGSGNLWWYECGDSELHVSCVPEYQAHVRPHVAIRVRDLPT